jgi:hypothetical protein
MPEFKSYFIPVNDTAPEYGSTTIEGPSAASVGWIPFFANLSELPACEYLQHALAKSAMLPSGLSVLFQSGNVSRPNSDDDPNPERFGDNEHFCKLVASKNYRGALALDDVKMVVAKGGAVRSIAFRAFREKGYTPMRVAWGSLTAEHFALGRGSADCDVDTREFGVVTIRQWVRPKLCRLADLGSLMLTGRLAPSAYLGLEYRMENNGRISVYFSGSDIPSQSYYIKWEKQGGHDMLQNKMDLIDVFLNAGACKDASNRLLLQRNMEYGIPG